MPALLPDATGTLAIDGHLLHWERFGTGERETVVLLNGLAMHCKAWYGFVPRLASRWDVVLFDYPGQGETVSQDEPVRLDRVAAYLVAILDALAIRRVHLMGISYGGFVALEFARQFQERLATLTLSGILLSHERLFALYQDLSLRFYAAGPDGFDLYTRYMYEKIFGEAFVRRAGADLEAMRIRFRDRYCDRIGALVRLTEAQDPFFAALDANLPQYRAIATPTLVVAGSEDRCIPPVVQRRIASILPHVDYEEMADCGHVVYVENPDSFFSRLEAHMQGQERGG